ncbi:MAG: hypothetical protein KKF56_05115 [Nanoarchaeota archaeon]|nr:hypothetical protein [Nanoarchaeota archaeon]
MARYKITKGTPEPRFELTYLNKGNIFELYHEPSGGIDKFSEKELLKWGFTKTQLNFVKKKGTTNFVSGGKS